MKAYSILCLLFFTACTSKVEPVFDSQYERRYGHGSILGGEGLTFGAIKTKNDPSLRINRYLWHAALDRVKNLPLVSTDGVGGVIVTDWYEVSHSEKFKITVLIFGSELKANAFNVKIHRQIYKDNQWTTTEADPFMITKLEDAILRQARLFQIHEKGS